MDLRPSCSALDLRPREARRRMAEEREDGGRIGVEAREGWREGPGRIGTEARAWDRRRRRNFLPQRWFHAVSKELETVHACFKGMKRFSSLPFSFHTKISFLLMCHYI